MLKIKDNVDLKELENFGFKYYAEICAYVRLIDEKDTIKKQCFVSVVSKINSTNIGLIPKVIYLHTPFSISTFEDKSFEYIIDDLIQADLVEKVNGEDNG